MVGNVKTKLKEEVLKWIIPVFLATTVFIGSQTVLSLVKNYSYSKYPYGYIDNVEIEDKKDKFLVSLDIHKIRKCDLSKYTSFFR